MTNEQLNAMIKEMKMLHAHVEDLQAQENAIKEAIREYMNETGEEVHQTGIYKISMKLFERKDVDKKRLEEDGILAKYQKVTPYIRLDIK